MKLILLRLILCKFTFFFCLALLFFSLKIDALELKKISFEGVSQLYLLEEIKQFSTLSSESFTSESSLKRKALEESNSISQFLYRWGYFEAKVTPKIIPINDQFYNATFNITLGKAYQVDSFTFENLPIQLSKSAKEASLPSDLGLKLNSPLNPKSLEKAHKQLLSLLKDDGFGFATISTPKVEVHLQTKSCSVSWMVSPGPLLYFGEIEFEGNSTLDKEFLSSFVAWTKDERFSFKKTQTTTKNLENLGLFEAIQITYPNSLEENESSLPVSIVLFQERPRTLAAGINYTTQLGIGGELEWQHRNLANKAIQLSSNLLVFESQKTLDFNFKNPKFIQDDQQWLTKIQLKSEELEGFHDKKAMISSWIEYKKNEALTFSYGSALSFSHTTQSDNNKDFLLLSFPLTVKVNNSPNNALYSYTLTPTLDLNDSQIHYLKQEATFKYPLMISETSNFHSNAYLQLGSITLNSRQELPPSQRFYGGGPQFFRGYNYQTVSPLDQDNKPLGGRSYWLAGSDIHFPMTSSLGLEFFFEAGNVYEDTLPSLKGEVLKSVGTGLSFSTPLGPLKIEAAVPINRREDVDSSAQFYITLEKLF
jgi:translocation and assembly module TamA